MQARLPMAIGLAALALGGAAGCGGDDDDGGGQAATTPAPPPTTAQQSTPTATTPASGKRPVSIVATEFKFTPSDISAKAGETTFRLRNEGGAPHALEIEGNGLEEATDVIQGGQNAELKANLKPGRYEIYCPVGNHRQQGMEGTLTVS